MSDGTALLASPTRIENPRRIILGQFSFKPRTTDISHTLFFFHLPKFAAVSM
jgi:hypothetical protein